MWSHQRQGRLPLPLDDPPVPMGPLLTRLALEGFGLDWLTTMPKVPKPTSTDPMPFCNLPLAIAAEVSLRSESIDKDTSKLGNEEVLVCGGVSGVSVISMSTSKPGTIVLT